MSEPTKSDGSGTLFHDARIGNLVNSVVSAGIGAAITILGSIDWSVWPAWVGMVGGPIAGLAAGWLTSKALPRYKRQG
jgi:hypothetical protein